MNIALIPARGGSKRILGKNIKHFCGKPIIAYSIEAARKAGVFDRIIVSTDSDKIATVARQCGAEVPFVRPSEIANNFATTASVIEHGLQWLEDQGEYVDHLCCIYATAPFVQPDFIKQGFDKIVAKRVSSVFTVTGYQSSIYRALQINEDGHLAMVFPEHELTRSNDLPETYSDAGQFYWLEAKRFMESRRIYNSDSLPIILPRFLVQDIDTPEDWQTAELMYKVAQKKFFRGDQV